MDPYVLPDRAQLILRVGVPRLLKNAAEVAAAMERFDARHPASLLRQLAAIPGAEVLGVAASIDSRRRGDLLAGIALSDEQKIALERIFERMGDSVNTNSIAAVARGLLSGDVAAEMASASVEEYAFKYSRSNIPRDGESAFVGRARELAAIRKWFGEGIRRVTISGVGGQGKTSLAVAVARAELEVSSFRAAVMIHCEELPNTDVIAAAVSTIGATLTETVADSESVRALLSRTPTLLVFDSVEYLRESAMRDLLDVGAAWSDAGDSRLLVTSRRSSFGHPKFEGGSYRQLTLGGLDRAAAFELVERILNESATAKATSLDRAAVSKLIDVAGAHPLTVRLLASQLIRRDAEALGRELEAVLDTATGGGRRPFDLAAGLEATLEVAIRTVSGPGAEKLRRLGVLQGGATEASLLAIADIEEREWSALRRQLQQLGLVELEELPVSNNAVFVRFHPVFGAKLWGELDSREQGRLANRHQDHYCHLAITLYEADRRSPREARALAIVEMPNLLHAVNAAVDHGSSVSIASATSLKALLDLLGRRGEARALSERLGRAAAALSGAGSLRARVSSGEEFYSQGRFEEAIRVFEAALGEIGESPSMERAAILANLARSLTSLGRPEEAVGRTRLALKILDHLEPGEGVTRLRVLILTEAAEAMAQLGQLSGAREAYEEALRLARSLGDSRTVALVFGHLASLEVIEGRYREALELYQQSLEIFSELGEVRGTIRVHHQLGSVLTEVGRLEEAESHYREALVLAETQGDVESAARTSGQLGHANVRAGRLDVAAQWYSKALQATRASGDRRRIAGTLLNLASAWYGLGKLEDARQSAEEALDLLQDESRPNDAWRAYELLSGIAASEAYVAQDPKRGERLRSEAQSLARAAVDLARISDVRQEMIRRHARLIVVAVAATEDVRAREVLFSLLPDLERRGWNQLALALRRLVEGQRDFDHLREGLDVEDSIVVDAVLSGLAEPEFLARVLATASSVKDDDRSALQ